jgi:hypothetical protein
VFIEAHFVYVMAVYVSKYLQMLEGSWQAGYPVRFGIFHFRAGFSPAPEHRISDADKILLDT